MKFRRTLYIIIGALFIIVNLIVDIQEYSHLNQEEMGSSYNIGYFIGSNIVAIFGVLFLVLGTRLNKKIKAKQSQEIERDINQIGKM